MCVTCGIANGIFLNKDDTSARYYEKGVNPAANNVINAVVTFGFVTFTSPRLRDSPLAGTEWELIRFLIPQFRQQCLLDRLPEYRPYLPDYHSRTRQDYSSYLYISRYRHVV